MTWVMSWLGNTITTLGGWDLDSNVALTSCHPSSTHPSKFRLSELLPVLWFLSPSLAAAWHTLIFQAELPIFHSGFQNSDKESPYKMMSEVFFFLSLGISVFNGNLLHLSPKKKNQSAASEDLDKTSVLGSYFWAHSWSPCVLRRRRQRKAQKGSASQGLDGGFLRPQGNVLEQTMSWHMRAPNCVSSGRFTISRMKHPQFNSIRYNNIQIQSVLNTYIPPSWLFSEMGSATNQQLVKL